MLEAGERPKPRTCSDTKTAAVFRCGSNGMVMRQAFQSSDGLRASWLKKSAKSSVTQKTGSPAASAADLRMAVSCMASAMLGLASLGHLGGASGSGRGSSFAALLSEVTSLPSESSKSRLGAPPSVVRLQRSSYFLGVEPWGQSLSGTNGRLGKRLYHPLPDSRSSSDWTDLKPLARLRRCGCSTICRSRSALNETPSSMNDRSSWSGKLFSCSEKNLRLRWVEMSAV